MGNQGKLLSRVAKKTKVILTPRPRHYVSFCPWFLRLATTAIGSELDIDVDLTHAIGQSMDCSWFMWGESGGYPVVSGRKILGGQVLNRLGPPGGTKGL